MQYNHILSDDFVLNQLDDVEDYANRWIYLIVLVDLSTGHTSLVTMCASFISGYWDVHRKCLMPQSYLSPQECCLCIIYTQQHQRQLTLITSWIFPTSGHFCFGQTILSTVGVT